MKIIYNENPLLSFVVVDDDVRKIMEYAIQIEDLQELAGDILWGKEQDTPTIKARLEENAFKDIPKDQVDMYCEFLSDIHMGDCILAACSCFKCRAEDLLGISTTEGFNSNDMHYINNAFSKDRTISEAIDYLESYNPEPAPKSWEGKEEMWKEWKPKWIVSAKEAAIKLRTYKEKHGF